MYRRFILMASILGFFGVALGAFGAHGLESTLEANDRVDTFNTATRYHMYHALALIGIAWLTTHISSKFVIWSGYLLLAGTIIFSGSLYILAIADIGLMGAIAPIGGACLLAGWGLMGYAVWQER